MMGSQVTQIIALAILLVSPWCIESQIPQEDLFKKPKNFERFSSRDKESFSDDEIDLILDIHNAYRSQVQPPAKDMRELVWDYDLEAYAKEHSSECTGGHSERTMIKQWNSNYQETWNFMAENLYYSFEDKYSIEEALYLWWEEGENYDINTHICSKMPCGHYEQVVLASSSRVGCAIKYCETFSHSEYPTPATFIQCNYDGLFLGNRRPYTVGERCLDCTRDKLGYYFQFCRYGLCIGPTLKFGEFGYDGNTTVAFGSMGELAED